MIKVDIINEVSKAADITKVKAEVAVPLPRPRPLELRLSPEFAAIKRRIWAELGLAEDVRQRKPE